MGFPHCGSIMGIALLKKGKKKIGVKKGAFGAEI
jgi:hypothetical protein